MQEDPLQSMNNGKQKSTRNNPMMLDIDQLDNNNSPQLPTLLNTLIKKDKEIEYLKKEVAIRDEKQKEFEYLIIKASDEIKKKQTENNNLLNMIENLKSTTTVNQELTKSPQAMSKPSLNTSNVDIKNPEVQSMPNIIQLKIELQKEKEANALLTKALQETKNQLVGSMQELKNSFELLQKTHAVTLQKMNKIEGEYKENTKMIEQLNQESIIKDEAIDNAHEIITKLKEEIEELNIKCNDYQAKIKKYKTKCRNFKSNNQKLNEDIHELEEKCKSQELCLQDYTIIKSDIQNLMKAKIDDKSTFSDERAILMNENILLEQKIEILQDEKLKLQLEVENQRSAIALELDKNKEICAQLIDKEDTIVKLTAEIDDLQKKHKAEFDEFKNQASKTLGILNSAKGINTTASSAHKNKLASTNYPSTNDFASPSNMKYTNKNFSSLITGESNMKSKGILRTTSAIKEFTPKEFSLTESQKLGNFSMNETFGVGDNPKLTNVNPNEIPTQLQGRGQTQAQTQSQPEVAPKNKSFKELMSAEILRDELDKTLKIEYTLRSFMENTAQIGEKELLPFMNALKDKPSLSPEAENSLMRCEELEQKYNELAERYEKASQLIEELLKNNKIMNTNIIDFIPTIQGFKDIFQNQSEYWIKEFNNLVNLQKETIKTDSDIYHNLANSLESHSKKNTSEYEDIINELKKKNEQMEKELLAIEEFTKPNLKSLKFNNNLANPLNSARGKDTTTNNNNITTTTTQNEPQIKKDLSSKLTSQLMNFQTQISELIDEKQHLLESITKIENDYKALKIDFSKKEKQYIESISEREKIIQNKESEIEELISKINKDDAIKSVRDNLLQDKEETIALMRTELNNLYKTMTEANAQIANYIDRNDLLESQVIELKNMLNLRDEQISARNEDITQLKASLKSMKTQTTQQLQEIENIVQDKQNIHNIEYDQSKLINRSVQNTKPHHNEVLLSDELYHLKQENKELLFKLEQLNSLVSKNKLLEHELSKFKPPIQRDGYNIKNIDSNSNTGLFDPSYISNCLNLDGSKDPSYNNIKLEDITDNKASADFIEHYKNKTKKVFQKRIKELELLLKFIDEKLKGFNYNCSGYISPCLIQDIPTQDELKSTIKLNSIVESLLNKNSALKEFIDKITQNIDLLYVKYYNLAVFLAKILKLFIQLDDDLSINRFWCLPELELLIQNPIPPEVNIFDHIEIRLSNILAQDKSPDFFQNFQKIEQKLSYLHEYLLSYFNSTNEFKQKYNHNMLRTKDFINHKILKLKEIESLYHRLQNTMDKDKNLSPNLVQINFFDYNEAFQSIFNTTYAEIREVTVFIQHFLNDTIERPSISLNKKGLTLSKKPPKIHSTIHSAQKYISHYDDNNISPYQINSGNDINQIDNVFQSNALMFDQFTNSQNKSPSKTRQLQYNNRDNSLNSIPYHHKKKFENEDNYYNETTFDRTGMIEPSFDKTNMKNRQKSQEREYQKGMKNYNHEKANPFFKTSEDRF